MKAKKSTQVMRVIQSHRREADAEHKRLIREFGTRSYRTAVERGRCMALARLEHQFRSLGYKEDSWVDA